MPGSITTTGSFIRAHLGGLPRAATLTAVLFGTVSCMDAASSDDSTLAPTSANASPKAATKALTLAPDVSVTMTPHNVPVVIPPTGGSFDYDVHIVNEASADTSFEAWTELTGPDGTVTSPIFGPASFALPGSWSADRMLSYSLPESAAAGSYTYTINLGTYPSTVRASTSFAVDKTPAGTGSGWIAQVYDNPYPVLLSTFFVDDQHGWIAGTRNTILATDDGGDNWYEQTIPGTVGFSAIHFIDANQGWATGSNGKVIHTTDGGQHWQLQPTVSSYPLNAVFFTDANTGWVAGGKSRSFTEPRAIVLHTSDGGNTWTYQLSAGNVTPLADLYFVDASTGWAVGDAGTIYATTNGGATWTQQTSGVWASLRGLWFIDRNNGWAVGTNGTLLHTVNGGSTWSTQNLGSTNNLSAVRFVNASEGWISGGSGTTGLMLHTDDGGATWAAQDVGDANYLYDLSFTDAQNGWAAGLYGSIIHTETGGR
jgi:photosystem II stability/assembly factor-like uncharacterized protein